MTMLEFEVVPGRGLKGHQLEFQVGMPICGAIQVLQRHGVRAIDLLYSPNAQEGQTAQDITLVLVADGIRLSFEGLSQRLKLIEVFDLSKIILKYCGNTVASPTDKPNVTDIDRCFGATHPGVYDPVLQLYTVSWRGLSVSFPVESTSQIHHANGLSALQFPDGSSPAASKMSIFQEIEGESGDSKVPAVPITIFYGNAYLNGRIKVIRSCGRTAGLSIPLSFENSGTGRSAELQLDTRRQIIKFGDSMQKVMELLGSPNRVFYKADDKMKIHLPQAVRDSEESAGIFCNYFTLGLDVLFSGDTNRVKKFILHTNHPGHFDFGIYYRCHFALPLTGGWDELTNNFDSPDDFRGDDVVWEMSRWDELQAILYDCHESGHLEEKKPPVVLNRVSSSGGCTNPFGSTFCYAYEDIIFEVMSNNLLASITLCD